MIIGIAGKAGSGKDLVGNIIQYLIACKKCEGMDCFKADYVNRGFTLEAKYTNISKWETKKFADKLKDIVCLLTGCTRADLEDREFKNNRKFRFENKWYGSVREFLQYFGTDLIRKNLGDDIWVNALMSEYKPKQATIINSNCPRQGVYDVTEEDELIYGTIDSLYPNWIITDVRFPNEIKAIKDNKGIIIKINRFPKGILNQIKVLNKEHISENSLDTYEEFDYTIDNNGTIEDLIKKVKEILIKEKII